MTLNRTTIEQKFSQLLTQEINSYEELIIWIQQCDTLDSQLGQDYAWKYIKQTTHTTNETAKHAYKSFLQDIYPAWIVISDKIGRKLVACPYIETLPASYHNYLRGVQHAVKYFREENVVLIAQEKEIESQWAEIAAAWTISYLGAELTLQQANEQLKSNDPLVRKIVFELMEERRHQDHERIDIIMSELVTIRTKIANNCGFDSYTDYKFAGRYDYTKTQINEFHEAIRMVISPIMKGVFEDRRQGLAQKKLQPYDFEVPLISNEKNERFATTDDMIDKLCFLVKKMDPEFETFIRTMQAKNQLDLDTRPNKAPGGYNYPLSGSAYSFIFMNAMRDHNGRFTWAHEAGHGIHHYLTNHLPLDYQRDCPSEICEIASMSMELFTMDDLQLIGLSEPQIKDGIYQKIIHDIGFFPYMSKIDLFQQRMYDHPNHTIEERKSERRSLNMRYPYAMRTYETNARETEYSQYLDYYRQRQMHLFEVPFYYIEYGIAQLASLQLYNQFLIDRPTAIKNYKKILSDGYVRSIPEIMKLGEIDFDVSESTLRKLMQPMIEKYKKL